MRAVKTLSLFHGRFQFLIIFAAGLSGLPFFNSIALANNLQLLVDLNSPTGPSRRWSAGIPISPYSQVDMNHGRVLTALPVVSWDGRGPGIYLTLYHHMTSAWDLADEEKEKLTSGEGLPEGVGVASAYGKKHGGRRLLTTMPSIGDEPIWSHTYQACLAFSDHGQKITVIWGNGTQDVYIADKGDFQAQIGVFDKLTVLGDLLPILGYAVTTKAQYVYTFDPNGQLETISDPSGNLVTCHYITNEKTNGFGELSDVEDSSGRQLTFTYNEFGRLAQIGDPLDRHWNLLYYDAKEPAEPKNDVDGPFVAFEDAMGSRINWTYTNTSDWDIATITDKDDNEYTYEYTLDNGRLLQVTDPESQETDFSFTRDLSSVTGTYTDVRGNDWIFVTDSAGVPPDNLMSVTNPLSETTSYTYSTLFDSVKHKVATITNPLNKTWSYTYDESGNLLTATNPLSNKTTYTYDELNNLRTVTPPADTANTSNTDKTVTYKYCDELHPTSPTEVVLPADGQGNAAVSIVLEYYDSGVPEAYGELKSITDANGVQTLYEYEAHGHLWRVSEGDPTGSIGDKVVNAVFLDPLGRFVTDLGRCLKNLPELGEEKFSGFLTECHPGICSAMNANGNITDICCCSCFLLCVGLNCEVQTNDCSKEGPSLSNSGNHLMQTAKSFTRSIGCPPFYVSYSDTGGPAHFDYNGMGSLTNVEGTVSDGSFWDSPSYLIDTDINYDSLGRMTSNVLSTNQPVYNTPMSSTPINRSFSYVPDSVAGTLDRTGPDGQVTHVETDEAGRVTLVTRGTTKTPAALSVAYTYYANGQVHTVTYGNGTLTTYTYDDAGQVTNIEHQVISSGDQLLGITYTYTGDGLIDTVEESYLLPFLIPIYDTATIAYTYDNRNQLIEEERTFGNSEYHYAYTYDQGGNRLTKTDLDNELHGVLLTEYHYDLEDIKTYGTWNNRLMYYEVFDSDEKEPVLLDRVDYEYQDGYGGEFGNPTRIVHLSLWYEPDTYEALTLQYNKQHELRFASWQGWAPDDCKSFEAYEVVELGGTGRARHLIRERDPDDTSTALENDYARWSDYDGDVIYDDYVVETDGKKETNIIPTVAYLPGVGQMWLDPVTGEPLESAYYHTDHLGTLRVMTGDGGSIYGRASFTSFGELDHATGGFGTRYQYGGSSGYETFDEFPAYVHVGHRYYDPSTGRFLQRDPIGIRGGINTYAYVGNHPANSIDPLGLDTISVGMGGSGIAFPFAGDCSLMLNLDDDGGISLTSSLGFLFGIGLGYGYGPQVMFTNAKSVADLSGTGSEAGILTPIGGISHVGMTGKNGVPIDGVQISVGPGAGGGVYGVPTSTVTIFRTTIPREALAGPPCFAGGG